MTEGTPKAIEMKGIVRNATKIGVQDGQAEDLINLRFMDGSWRASGNGRQIENMPTGTIYQQLYVHTNIYHHLLGVDNGTLYWFAEIDNDGVTFYPLDGTSDRSLWPEDKQDLPTERVALTTVTGSMWITQTGHLLTIIDEADDFEHFVFKTGEDKYIEVNMDVNGKPTDRSLYPFGQVHFNLYSDPNNSELVHQKQVNELDLRSSSGTIGTTKYWDGENDPNTGNLQDDGFIDKENEKNATKFYHNIMVELFGEATKKNQFTRPFLALVAYKLYDGSYLYSSNPVLLFPRELISSDKGYAKSIIPNSGSQEPAPVINYIQSGDVCTLFENAIIFSNGNVTNPYNFVPFAPGGMVIGRNKENVENGSVCGCFLTSGMNHPWEGYRATEQPGVLQRCFENVHHVKKEHVPVYCNGVAGYYSNNHSVPGSGSWHGTKYRAAVIGSQLCLSVEDRDFLKNNSDIVNSLCVFVTPQADLWNMEADNGDGRTLLHMRTLKDSGTNEGDIVSTSIMTISYSPKRYDIDKVIGKLLNSPFYLLKEYTKNTIDDLYNNPIIDLNSYQLEGLLSEEILVQQKTLDTEALSRTTYLPKVSYMYNGRLHIANYKSHPFFGYPIDLFHLHNHSVKVQDGAWFKGVLPNLADNNDAYLQYPKEQVAIEDAATLGDNGALINAAAPYFLVKVFIDTAQGEQIVTRYIPAYDPTTPKNGRADFIEDLNPLLTYPDARAKKMQIYFVDHYSAGTQLLQEGYYIKRKEFTLKPHPYLNMAYYIDSELMPIKLSEFDNWPANIQPLMQ